MEFDCALECRDGSHKLQGDASGGSAAGGAVLLGGLLLQKKRNSQG